jgi:hypothetical protein
MRPSSPAFSTRILNERFARELEIHPNRIQFHTVEALRIKQGVGTQLKEQRVVDHRPGASGGNSINSPNSLRA